MACALLLLDHGADRNLGVTGSSSSSSGSGGSGRKAAAAGGVGGTENGVTPLLAAIESKHDALVDLLLKRGADSNLGAHGGNV